MSAAPNHIPKGWWQLDAAAVILCIALAAVAYVFGFKPILDERAAQFSHQRTMAQQEAEEDTLQTTIRKLRSRLSQVQRAVEESSLVLQATGHLNTRIDEVTRLASSCGLQLNEIQPGRTISGDRYEMIEIRLAGAGEYENVARFIHRLHLTLRDTGVRGFDVNGSPKQPNAPATFRFDLVWYAAPSLNQAGG